MHLKFEQIIAVLRGRKGIQHVLNVDIGDAYIERLRSIKKT